MSVITGVSQVAFVSGGAGDPLTLSGTADPTAGLGVVAPEGSIYLRYGAGAGEMYIKTGAADTAWSIVAAPPATQSNLIDEVDLLAPAATIQLTPLSGDADGTYECWAHLLVANGVAPDGELNFNGDSAAGSYRWRENHDGTYGNINADTKIRMWYQAVALDGQWIDLIFQVRAIRQINAVTRDRSVIGRVGRYSSAASHQAFYHSFAGIYTSNAADLSSIELTLAGGNNWQTGSRAVIYQRTGDGGYM